MAFVEQPVGDGWRVRYCGELVWNDGPGEDLPDGQFDLQGIATRMHGFAIGLFHTTVPGSTMYPAPGRLDGERCARSSPPTRG